MTTCLGCGDVCSAAAAAMAARISTCERWAWKTAELPACDSVAHLHTPVNERPSNHPNSSSRVLRLYRRAIEQHNIRMKSSRVSMVGRNIAPEVAHLHIRNTRDPLPHTRGYGTVSSLYVGERTGPSIFLTLWSYVTNLFRM